jgi:hypothetical protein
MAVEISSLPPESADLLGMPSLLVALYGMGRLGLIATEMLLTRTTGEENGK